MNVVPSKCIVIGGGRISLSHIPHLISHPCVELLGIIEPNRLLRFMLRKLFRVKVYRSVGALGNLQFDAVFVLTPPSSHFSIAKEHLLDGKHIFLEKPMTLSPEESYELLNLAKKKKVQFSCGYVYRHHPIYREIKRIVSNGVYGSPMACKIAMRGNVVKADSPVSWRRAGKGSGCLYDYGCHVIDLSIFLFGKPGSVECLSKEELFQTGVVDRFSVELNHNEFFDVQSCITCDWADQNVRKAGLVLEISTNDHFIFCDGQTIAVSGATSRKYSIKDLDSDVGFYLRGEEFQRQTDEFFLSIANSTFSYLDAEDAVTTDAIILEIYEKVI